MNSWFVYLAEVTICQLLFGLLYVGVFRNLPFFQANRVLILSATILSFIVPVLTIPIWNAPVLNNSYSIFERVQQLELALVPDSTMPIPASSINFNWWMIVLSIVYLIGFTYRFWKLLGGILMLVKLIQKNKSVEENGTQVIHLNSGPSFFSFLNYIFINTNQVNISEEEFSQVIEHERTHIAQRHTLDNLLMEVSILICWFNPILRFLKKELNNVHEFYADAKAAAFNGSTESYSKLILKLASNKRSNLLTHQFSMNTFKKRIIMLNETKHSKRIALRYILVAPCLMLLLAAFSFVPKNSGSQENLAPKGTPYIIGNISWEGNSLYSDDYLSGYLGLKKGDMFNEEGINQSLSYRPEGRDLGSLFMDRGYLYFTVEMKKEIIGNKVDITFDIFEGKVSVIDNVSISGNKKVPTEQILKMVDTVKGELFSRSKLASSQKRINESGLFKEQKLIPNIVPNPSEGTVDIEFKVVEL
ncbi:POTRA domain-containing protein [uncultured Cyclobacterium sp.]|uniref:POTRA domain-containing protein n=1 Tax=uncultured Cyclobacterium sp. TaxID=453820 RepID=UPI0030EEEB6F|tara:strand:+ start:11094 stop:12515 length:1422 start_codon:yes stop_codon:yes gene_type:complete